jgi:hypothetical protein
MIGFCSSVSDGSFRAMSIEGGVRERNDRCWPDGADRRELPVR